MFKNRSVKKFLSRIFGSAYCCLSQVYGLKFKLSREKYGESTLRLARSLERNQQKQVRYKLHLRFFHQSQELNLLPRFIKFKPPISHPKAQAIARRAGWSYLRLIISACHDKLKKVKSNVVDDLNKIKAVITDEENTVLAQVISRKNQRSETYIRSRHQRKLQRPENSTDLADGLSTCPTRNLTNTKSLFCEKE